MYDVIIQRLLYLQSTKWLFTHWPIWNALGWFPCVYLPFVRTPCIDGRANRTDLKCTRLVYVRSSRITFKTRSVGFHAFKTPLHYHMRANRTDLEVKTESNLLFPYGYPKIISYLNRALKIELCKWRSQRDPHRRGGRREKLQARRGGKRRHKNRGTES